MRTEDKQEFTRSLAVLCSGFDVPVTDERSAAYWMAFNRLSLIEWQRVVEAAVGEQGAERMPTVKQLWTIRKRMKSSATIQRNAPQVDVPKLLTDEATRRFKPSDRQKVLRWSYITRWFGGVDQRGEFNAQQGVEYLGVIIPQDDYDPAKFPARRLMVTDLQDAK